MPKKTYKIQDETLSILSQPNQTYNGKDIPQTITTAGVFIQSEGSLEISNLEGLPESETPEFKYLNQFHKESTERTLKKIAESKKSPLTSEIAIAQMLKNSKDY
jgi:hypothetical protein